MYDMLTALIRETETGKTDPAVQYQTIIGHNQRHLDKPVTEMTVDEIINASDSWRKRFGTTSGAAGAYQIIKPTLVQLKKDLGLSGSERFTPALQDHMCAKLLQKRGASQFLAGELSVVSFGNNLAREWASFPVLSTQKRGNTTLKRGQSYYDKVAGNSALIKPALVEGTLAATLAAVRAERVAPEALAPPTYQPGDTDEPAPSAPGFGLIDALVLVAVVLAALVVAYFFWPR